MELTISNDQITCFEKPVQVFSKSPNFRILDAHEYSIETRDCGYTIILDNIVGVVGIMIPTLDYYCLADEEHLDTVHSQRYYFPDDERLTRELSFDINDCNLLTKPVLHIENPMGVYSWSCTGECLITTCQSEFTNYANIESYSYKSVNFFVDKSSNYHVNEQRFSLDRKEVLINDTVSTKFLGKYLYRGYKPREHPIKPYDMIKNARHIQIELSKFNIKSCIIGSLAQRLNHIPVDVNDLDIMVSNKKDLDNATVILESSGSSFVLNKNHTRIILELGNVDLCYDNFNILYPCNYHIIRHGLTFCSIDGLLWLYFFNLFSACTEEHSHSYKDKVQEKLCSIGKYMPRSDVIIHVDIELPTDFSDKCVKMCNELQDYDIQYRDIKINKPFRISCFKKDHNFLYPVINNGSITDAQIILDVMPSSVSWEDLGGNVQNPNVQKHDEFSVITLHDVYLPGLLRVKL